MYIALNRFKVKHGMEQEFEKIWRNRETHLDEVPGFCKFNLIKGPKHDDHCIYASHSLWESEKFFIAWTNMLASNRHKNYRPIQDRGEHIGQAGLKSAKRLDFKYP